MMALDLKECDRLDSASNFIPCKHKLYILIEKAKNWENVEKVIVSPNDLMNLATLNKEAKAK
jgi:hypothetical protein